MTAELKPTSPDRPAYQSRRHQHPLPRTNLLLLLMVLIALAVTSPLAARTTHVPSPKTTAAAITISRTGGYSTSGFANDVDIADGYAYIADGLQGVQIVDVRTPSTPQLIGSHRTPSITRSVAVEGQRAYVLYGESAPHYPPDTGTQIVDISDPTHPQLRETLPFSRSFRIVANLAYVSSYDAFEVYDISNPAKPSLRGRLAIPGEYSFALEVMDNFAYLATERSGDITTRLHIIDISDPTHPTIRSQVALSYQWKFNDLAVANNLVYVAATNSLRSGGSEGRLLIYDVSIPGQPVERANYLTSHVSTTSVAARGNLVYIGSYSPNDSRGSIEILDTSDAARPSLLAQYDALTTVNSIRVVGSRVYVADGNTGLQILSVDTPHQQYLSFMRR